jgi:3-methyladenine DNA glycosylase AlkD
VTGRPNGRAAISATSRATAFVAAHRPAADDLGRRLAADVDDPDALASTLRAGLEGLADPEYRAGQQFVAPGLGPTLGVRLPLLTAVGRAFRTASRRTRASELLFVADRLFREDVLEPRWLAVGLLDRVLVDDPERAWQLLRRAAREATDWITVDTLAHAWGRGVLGEPYRWAELEQLVFSPSRWERRLVGSTVATIPFIDRRAGRAPDVARHGLDLLDELIGDSEPDVQKALAWALRSLVLVDAAAVTAYCDRQAAHAAATADGHRAWVVRDALPKLDPADAVRLRATLIGVRRRPGARSTSRAAETAGRFADLGLGRPLAQPPLAEPLPAEPALASPPPR